MLAAGYDVREATGIMEAVLAKGEWQYKSVLEQSRQQSNEAILLDRGAKTSLLRCRLLNPEER